MKVSFSKLLEMLPNIKVIPAKGVDIQLIINNSPEFNPDEQVWNHLKNHELKNHDKTTTKELKRLVRKKLNKVSRSMNLIMGIF